ncbi:hypothetical protein ACWDKQ_12515 [Saccharopolyspora sp. NPDC000995]
MPRRQPRLWHPCATGLSASLLRIGHAEKAEGNRIVGVSRTDTPTAVDNFHNFIAEIGFH